MVGDRIKEKLKEKGMSQSDLAKKINVSQQAVSVWVRHVSAPNSKNLKDIADVLDCSVGYLMGNEDVPDRELKKNGSGYNDPTAYLAMKNLEKNTKEVDDMEIKTGEIWNVEFGMQIEKVVVVASHGAYSTILKLTDEPRETRTISLPVFGMKYAEPGFVSYKFHDAFVEYVRTTTEAEFDDIMEKVKAALNIKQDKASEAMDSRPFIEMSRKLEEAEKELEELKKQPVFPPDSEEIVRLKAQIEVLEKQNERLLDRLIG